jgi:hypothetical protein
MSFYQVRHAVLVGGQSIPVWAILDIHPRVLFKPLKVQMDNLHKTEHLTLSFSRCEPPLTYPTTAHSFHTSTALACLAHTNTLAVLSHLIRGPHYSPTSLTLVLQLCMAWSGSACTGAIQHSPRFYNTIIYMHHIHHTMHAMQHPE